MGIECQIFESESSGEADPVAVFRLLEPSGLDADQVAVRLAEEQAAEQFTINVEGPVTQPDLTAFFIDPTVAHQVLQVVYHGVEIVKDAGEWTEAGLALSQVFDMLRHRESDTTKPVDGGDYEGALQAAKDAVTKSFPGAEFESMRLNGAGTWLARFRRGRSRREIEVEVEHIRSGKYRVPYVGLARAPSA
jgi:hypothetical protein